MSLQEAESFGAGHRGNHFVQGTKVVDSRSRATDRQWSSLEWRILGWSFNSELPSKLFMYRQQKDLQNEQDSFKGWAINTFTLHGTIRFVALSSLPRKRF